jgi:hypothetical protein
MKPLVDYSQSHVVASKKNLQIMKQKVVEKVATKKIKEIRRRERVKKQVRKATQLLI